MAHIEKQLLLSSPFIWKRFIDDIFSVWTSSKHEISNFVDFAYRFHATIKFTCEMSFERAVFLDMEVFKGSRFEQSTRCLNTLQSNRNVPIHAFLFVSHPPLTAWKRLLLKQRHFACYERTQLKKDPSQANGISNPGYSNAATHKSLLTK